jgi:hypothetical protein
MSSEREHTVSIQTRPDSICIHIGWKKEVWFGQTFGFPSDNTFGLILVEKRKFRLDIFRAVSLDIDSLSFQPMVSKLTPSPLKINSGVSIMKGIIFH